MRTHWYSNTKFELEQMLLWHVSFFKMYKDDLNFHIKYHSRQRPHQLAKNTWYNKTLQCNTLLSSLTWSLHFYQYVNSWNLFLISLSKLREKKSVYSINSDIFDLQNTHSRSCWRSKTTGFFVGHFYTLILWASYSSSIKKIH